MKKLARVGIDVSAKELVVALERAGDALQDSVFANDAAVRISKVGNRHLRRALFLPAMVASQHEPQVKAYYQQLLERGKKPLQALVAVMRKMLHAIFGMFKNDTDFVGDKFYALKA